jgi:glycosyltransferase involved in cell wall biosynthesis
MEWVHQLTDYRIKDFLRYKRFIEATLASPYCRKIICWSEFNRRHIEANLDTVSFGGKLVVVPWATPPRLFTKQYHDSTVNLLFVGSANTPGEFNEKGGLVLLESFKVLRERYPNVRLTIRSDVPREIKRIYGQVPGIRLLDRTLSPRELESEFVSSDIFVLPGHTYYTVFFEAMSYELPIVTTDIHANAELIENGINGLLISRSNLVQYYTRNLLPDFDAPGYRSAIQRPDPAMVQELTAKLSVLVENSDLRRKMGRAGRWQVEEGKYSIRNRNEKLEDLFDGLLASSD